MGLERGAGDRSESERESATDTDAGSARDVGQSITREPAVASSVAAVGLSIVAAALAGVGSPVGLLVGLAGIVLLAVALVRNSRRLVDVAGLVCFVGVVAGGLEATAVEPSLLATLAVVLAWDRAHGAIDVGTQLGREAPTRRLEAVSFASSLFVGVFAGTLGYAVYLIGGTGQPVAAVVLFVIAAALVTLGLGSDGRW
ncbi:hypothetical protein B1756_03135 [Natrarchaeobaculum aegyptiacum]|uniref:Uncharacterized protein n=1 Tax=Natrarchaeobaculum aegyptiacum TaxID=745377 RepID=A0A2Z2HWQ6_9EURY|nr:hypothetical protein B1756_03135 [Natrarchaeobaculum aegyptiacum]